MYRSILTVLLVGGFAAIAFATSGAAAALPVDDVESSEVGSASTDDGGQRTADAAERALTLVPDVSTAQEAIATMTGTADAAERRLVPVTEAVPAPTGTADGLERELVDDFDRLPKPDAGR